MDQVRNQLKEHEKNIARLSGELKRLSTSDTIDNLELEIKELLQELANELKQAENTVLNINPIKARLLITDEAVNLRKIRRARRKISNVETDFKDLDL